jgi:hypothetical protein
MKKNDLLLMIIVGVIGLVSYFSLQLILNNQSYPDGIAVVYFDNEEILAIELADGNYEILDETIGIVVDEVNLLFTVPNTNGVNDLVIEYQDHMVRVKEEVSPQNICSIQGWSNSPLEPITCIPNNLVIVIKKPAEEADIDDITS